jgi:hypothetical protein
LKKHDGGDDSISQDDAGADALSDGDPEISKIPYSQSQEELLEAETV